MYFPYTRVPFVDPTLCSCTFFTHSESLLTSISTLYSLLFPDPAKYCNNALVFLVRCKIGALIVVRGTRIKSKILLILKGVIDKIWQNKTAFKAAHETRKIMLLSNTQQRVLFPTKLYRLHRGEQKFIPKHRYNRLSAGETVIVSSIQPFYILFSNFLFFSSVFQITR